MYLLNVLKKVNDQRGRQGREFPLAEVLFMCILGASCGYTSYRKLALFISCKWDIFRRELELKRETPPKYNTLRSIILSVKTEELEMVFREHSIFLLPNKPKHLAADGKVMRGARDSQTDENAAQFLNIFAVNEKVILAHESIDRKTNEIPVFQKLIQELDIENVLFTADALHCQKKLYSKS